VKAIVQDTYGSADVLDLRDIDEPAAGDNEVLIRVHAAGVDRGVWHFMTGLPYLMRLVSGLRAPKARVPGIPRPVEVVTIEHCRRSSAARTPLGCLSSHRR